MAQKSALTGSTQTVISHLMNLDALVGGLVSDGELEDDLLVMVSLDHLAQLVGEVGVVHLRCSGLGKKVDMFSD